MILSYERFKQLLNGLIYFTYLLLLLECYTIVVTRGFADKSGKFAPLLGFEDSAKHLRFISTAIYCFVGLNLLSLILKLYFYSDLHLSPFKTRLYGFCIQVDLILLLASAIVLVVIYSNTSKLTKGVEEKLTTAIYSYNTNKPMKVLIDQLQMEAGCCGVRSFTDWFLVPWYPVIKESDLGTYGDDVPYSCCSTSHTLIPCLHHNLMSKLNVYETGGKNVGFTLWSSGCARKLSCIFPKDLFNVLALSSAVVLLQLPLIIGDRILQTIESADYFDVCKRTTQTSLSGDFSSPRKKKVRNLDDDLETQVEMCHVMSTGAFSEITNEDTLLSDMEKKRGKPLLDVRRVKSVSFKDATKARGLRVLKRLERGSLHNSDSIAIHRRTRSSENFTRFRR